MKTKKSLVYGVFAVLIALAFAACDGGGGGDPTVTGVTVNAAASFVNKGGTLQFSHVVNGTNSPSQAVTWTVVTTGVKSGTTISTTGLLTAASDEAVPSTIIVKATSTFDTSKYGIATVTVNDPNLQNLTGDVSISPAGSVTGTQLTATYSGTETITTYQWKKAGDNVGSNSNKFTPYEPGTYTVMVSATNYNSKISAPVTVTGAEVPIDDQPAENRWWKWVADDATATVDYSVAADGVCTITIGGTAQPNNETDDYGRWKASAGYWYTATSNTKYKYIFEAWTESGDRELGIQYYYIDEDHRHADTSLDITGTRTTYTIEGATVSYGGVYSIDFWGADKKGIFFVKILSIEPK